MVHRAAVIALLRSILRVLGRFLGLATLHLRFLQQTLLLGESLPFFPIFDLVLSDERFGWAAKDAFVFTEFADPNVFQGRGMMDIGVLLSYLALTCSQRVQTGGRSSFLAAHGSLVSLGRRLRARRDVLLHRRCHVGACLSALRGESTRVLRGGCKRRRGRSMRSGTMSLHGHAFCGVGFAGERELGLGWCGVIFLVQKADIAGASRRGGKGGSVSDSSRDDALVG